MCMYIDILCVPLNRAKVNTRMENALSLGNTHSSMDLAAHQ